jgi:hypothetical protein
VVHRPRHLSIVTVLAIAAPIRGAASDRLGGEFSELTPEASQAEAVDGARGVAAARQVLESGAVVRVVYVRGRMVNLVTTPPSASGANPG